MISDGAGGWVLAKGLIYYTGHTLGPLLLLSGFGLILRRVPLFAFGLIVNCIALAWWVKTIDNDGGGLVPLDGLASLLPVLWFAPQLFLLFLFMLGYWISSADGVSNRATAAGDAQMSE